MAKQTFFKSGGTSVIESTGTTDVALAEGLKSDYEKIYFSIAFYSDDTLATQTSPTTGTVEFLGYDFDIEQTIANGSFDADQTFSGVRVQPAAVGNFTSAKLTVAGVDSGLYFRAWVWQK